MNKRSIRSVEGAAPSKAFSDAAVVVGGQKEESDPKEEEKNWSEVVKALEQLGGGKASSELGAAITVISRTNPSKDQKFLTLRTVLAPIFDALGHVTDAPRHAVREGRPWVMPQEYLVSTYDLVKKMHEYFKEVPDEARWYVEALYHVADECLAAAQTGHYHFPLWGLSKFSQALDMAAEIHQLAPIDNFLRKHKGAVPAEKAIAFFATLKEKEQRKVEDVFAQMQVDYLEHEDK